MRSNIIKFIQGCTLVMAMVAATTILHAQTTLYATSLGRSYEQIDSTLGLNSGAMEETPDQCSNHPQFGRHILEVWDSTLNKYVYEFYIHIKSFLDNDRCINFDRQRAEIKTDASSPTYLKGYVGNKLTFSWMFKLPARFQEGPNFTHIHQIKAVGGDYSSPIFTLSPYNSGTKQEMQIVYVQDSTTSQVVVKQVAPTVIFSVACIHVPVAPAGLTSKAASSNVINLKWSESQNNLSVFTVERSFDGIIWDSVGNVPVGITAYSDSNLIQNTIYYYRVKAENPAGSSTYTDVSQTRTTMGLPVDLVRFGATYVNTNIVISWTVENEINFSKYEIEYSTDRISFCNLTTVTADKKSNYSYIQTDATSQVYYYRLKLVNKDGSFSCSNIISLTGALPGSVALYPNPAKDFITVDSKNISPNCIVEIQDALGRTDLKKILASDTSGTTTISTNGLANGNYFLRLIDSNKTSKPVSFIISR